MNLTHVNSRSLHGPHASRMEAFTLPEIMVAMSIFGIAVAAMLSSHLFGLRQDQLVRGKLGASDQARVAFSRMVGEIQTSKLTYVGNVAGSQFTRVPDGQLQQGTALEIYPSTNTTQFIRYFFDDQTRELHRIESGSGESRLIADHLAANMFFRREDHLGNVLKDYQHNHAIAFLVQFEQFQYPLTKVGEGHYYDYYKMEFRVTRRAQD